MRQPIRMDGTKREQVQESEQRGMLKLNVLNRQPGECVMV